jgi:hypothetical protein
MKAGSFNARDSPPEEPHTVHFWPVAKETYKLAPSGLYVCLSVCLFLLFTCKGLPFFSKSLKRGQYGYISVFVFLQHSKVLFQTSEMIPKPPYSQYLNKASSNLNLMSYIYIKVSLIKV